MITDQDIKNNIPSNSNSLITLRHKVFNRSNISLFFIDRRSTKDYEFLNKGEKATFFLGTDFFYCLFLFLLSRDMSRGI